MDLSDFAKVFRGRSEITEIELDQVDKLPYPEKEERVTQPSPAPQPMAGLAGSPQPTNEPQTTPRKRRF